MIESFRPTAESSREPDTENPVVVPKIEKKEKKSRKDKNEAAKKARDLGAISAEKVVESGAVNTEKTSERALSVWERFAGLSDKDKADRQPTIVVPTEKLADESQEPKVEKTPEKSDSDTYEQGEPVDQLTQEEAREVLKQYAHTAQSEIAAETQAGTTETGTVTEKTKKAEDAAYAELLNAIERELAENPDTSADMVLRSAENSTIDRIEDSSSAEISPPGPPPQSQETTSDESHEEQSVEYAGAAGGGGGSVPPGGVFGGHAGMPMGAGLPPSPDTQSRRGVAAANARETIFVQDTANERRAAAQGLLVGGIIGYLIGRRRGRIKTEKRLEPIQKKLEKQVAALQNMVAEKEQNVRKLAAEKIEQIRTSEEREAFVRRLSTRTETIGRKSESPLARPAIEVPAAVAIGAVAALKSGRRGEQPSVAASEKSMIDFSKNVDSYSSQELEQAAEKVRIDGVTLKQVARANRFDEKAVRRIMTEFVEGGNVRAAIEREVTEKERGFERDPRLRHAAAAAGTGLQGAASVLAAAAVGTAASDLGGANDASRTTDGAQQDSAAASASSKPVPDAATLARLKKQQSMQIAAAGGVVAVLVAVLAVLLF